MLLHEVSHGLVLVGGPLGRFMPSSRAGPGCVIEPVRGLGNWLLGSVGGVILLRVQSVRPKAVPDRRTEGEN